MKTNAKEDNYLKTLKVSCALYLTLFDRAWIDAPVNWNSTSEIQKTQIPRKLAGIKKQIEEGVVTLWPRATWSLLSPLTALIRRKGEPH